jgi:hypothetical protein
MSVSYFAIILSSSIFMKSPHPSYKPPNYVPPVNTSVSGANTIPDMSVEDIVRTKQFHLLGLTFFCLSTGGMGLLSVAKPMMSEVFSSALPLIVTSAFATKFVLMLSAGNLGGRLGWAAVSDMIGRRSTFLIFTAGSANLNVIFVNCLIFSFRGGPNILFYTYVG